MDLITMNQNLITLDHQVPTTTSLKIAEVFEREHFHVLNSIRAAIANLEKINKNNATDFRATDFMGKFLGSIHEHFVAYEYEDKNGDMKPAYNLTEQAFDLVALGFTGDKAFLFKTMYVSAFYDMKWKIDEERKRRAQEVNERLLNLEAVPKLYEAKRLMETKAERDFRDGEKLQKQSEKLSREYGKHYTKIMNKLEEWINRVHERTHYKHMELRQALILLDGHARFDDEGSVIPK